MAEGVEARLAAADTGAAGEAEADRRALLDEKGADANASEAQVELIESGPRQDPPEPPRRATGPGQLLLARHTGGYCRPI